MAKQKSESMTEQVSALQVIPRQLIGGLKACIKANRPAFIWGAPGIGKSEIMRLLAKELNLQLVDFRALIRDITDLTGLPMPSKDGNYTQWLRPGLLPERGKGIFFLDELNAAPPLMQALCYQLVHERCVGEHKLGDGWIPIAAGNNDTDGAVTSRMPTPLRSRFIHFELRPELEDWVAWAMRSDIKPEIMGFLRFKSNLLHSFDKNSRTFPCPRTWHMLSDLLISGIPSDIEFQTISGTIGEGASVEFMAFLRLFRELPDIDKLIENPSKYPVPKEPETLYAVASTLAVRASSENFSKIVTFLDRMPPEYAVMSMKDAVMKDEALAKTPTFVKWATKHGAFVL